MTIAKRIPLLVPILLLGLVLRLWNLELKPLWMDEIITAIFSFGRTYYDIPLEQALPISNFEQVFTLNSTSCTQITQTVSTQSVHPPLFFCWMHQWLSLVQKLPFSWVWQLRAFPALVGVVAIAAIYQLDRLAFSRKAGLIGAALMATSPFAVYLSQEARHYTLPMVLVLLALLGLYQILLDLRYRQFRPLIWLGWITVNSVGFYVHYFFLLAFVAQAVTLLLGQKGEEGRGRERNGEEVRSQESGFDVASTMSSAESSAQPNGVRSQASQSVSRRESGEVNTSRSQVSSSRPRHLTPSALRPLSAIALVCLTYLPWLPTFVSHMTRPETDWVKTKAPGIIAAIVPLFQIVSGWTLVGIALPVENQSLWVASLNAGAMALFSFWLAWRVGIGLQQLWQQPQSRLGIQMLGIFSLVVMLEFLAIAYLLGKDFTQVPRYNFIYFPAICALIGASLSHPITKQTIPTHHIGKWQIPLFGSRLLRWCDRQAVAIVLIVATFSSVLVISNYVFQKPYTPDQVARNMLQEPRSSLLVTSTYNDFQDLALGLSFALQLAKQEADQPQATEPHFAFIGKFQGYQSVWQQLAQMPQPLPMPLSLWIIAPGLKRVGYPPKLTLQSNSGHPVTCAIDADQHYRIGIPYQLYRCP